MREHIFEWLYVVGFVAGSVIRAAYTRRDRRNRNANTYDTPLDMLLVGIASLGLVVMPLLYLLTPWLAFADYDLPAWAGWVGAAVFALAVWLLWRSHADLGRNWSARLEIREDHSLVTHGVYGRIRHPMYAAHWLWGIAQALLLWNWIAGPALLAAFVPLWLLRVPREEQMMLERFGEKYRAYMSRTGRAIPRLWG